MNWVFDMNLSASDIIAIFALLVAGLAALYARWSSIEAKKANQISLISGRKEIYIAFLCTRQISQNPYPIRILPS